LRVLDSEVTWITARENLPLVTGLDADVRSLAWDEREKALDAEYDLLINLEDDTQVATFADSVRHRRRFGARLGAHGALDYTQDSQAWFDMSLISRFGRHQADRLKLVNRSSYQELVFGGLGRRFGGQRYMLPAVDAGSLVGDVAIAPVAGPVWPMKGWDFYADLKARLEADDLRVNVLPRRQTLLEHVADVNGHRCLVSGDSLPMHIALGLGKRCVTIFNCTSPWEIFDYGLQRKLVSPLLEEFFYRRDFDPRATSAIPLELAMRAVGECLSADPASPGGIGS
jgi:hypothetical protein